MIVHLFEDQKFVDVTIDNFNKVSKDINKYIVFSDKAKLRYVSKLESIHILPKSSYKLDVDFVYQNCKLLIIHFLSPIKLYILKQKPNHVNVLWSVWGADAYNHFSNQNNFELLTQRIRRRKLYNIFRGSILYTYYHFIRYRVKPVSKELELLKKINFLSTVLPYEFNDIKKEFNLDAKYIDYNYGANRFIDHSNIELGESVLVGNSATDSNNHLDIFDIIKEIKHKIVVPLSYGAYDYKDYRKQVIVAGNRLFNNNFIPITSYLSKEKYNQQVLSCNTAIMFHIRQQGLANIFNCLYLGMRVFLNRKSVTYRYFLDHDVIVFDLKKDYKLIGVNLTQKEKEHNKSIVIRMRGEDVIQNKIKDIITLYNSYTDKS